MLSFLTSLHLVRGPDLRSLRVVPLPYSARGANCCGLLLRRLHNALWRLSRLLRLFLRWVRR